MKKTFIGLMMLLLLVPSVHAASEDLNLHVSFSSLTPTLQTAKVVFTDSAVINEPDMSDINAQSNFNVFDSFASSNGIQESGFMLDIKSDSTGFFGFNETNSIYVTFQIFSGTPIDIEISQDGALIKQNPVDSGNIINWKVYLEGHENDMFVDTSVAEATKFVAYRSDPKHFGLCGSRRLFIKTDNFGVDKIGSYKASIKATVKPVV